MRSILAKACLNSPCLSTEPFARSSPTSRFSITAATQSRRINRSRWRENQSREGSLKTIPFTEKSANTKQRFARRGRVYFSSSVPRKCIRRRASASSPTTTPFRVPRCRRPFGATTGAELASNPGSAANRRRSSLRLNFERLLRGAFRAAISNSYFEFLLRVATSQESDRPSRLRLRPLQRVRRFPRCQISDPRESNAYPRPR